MSLMMKTPPLAIHGAAVYPYSPELHARYKLESRFEDEFEVCIKRESELWLPRRFAGPGETIDLRTKGVSHEFTTNFTASNPDQARVVGEMRNLLTLGRSHIVQAPTGYGKTYVGAAAVGHVQRRALILTTKEDLMGQWREALRNVLDLPDSMIGDWRGDVMPNPEQPIAIGLVQSVLKGPARYPKWMFDQWGLVIADEVHRMGADQFSQAMWWLPAELRLGLSATPYRKDGKEIVFHAHIGDIEVIGEQETLIPKVIVEHMPWKCPRRARKVNGKLVIDRVPHKAGRTMHILKSIEQCEKTTIKVTKFVRLAYAKGRTIVVFSDTMNHLKVLRASILKSGVKEEDTGWYVGLDSGVYTGGKKEKEKQRDKAKTAKVMFATYKMCSEGTNIPWLDTAVLAAPRGDVNQIVGRIRREYPGKQEPLVYQPAYMDSPVFASYVGQNLKWYQSLGAKVLVYR